MSGNAPAQRSTCFLDLCAAGAPLAAIGRCLASSRDQLQLAFAVGKRYRDLVCRQVTHLTQLNLKVAGCSYQDVRTFTRLLLRLEGVQAVQPRGDLRLTDWSDFDADGLMHLRLLPQLTSLCRLVCMGGDESYKLGSVCLALATLTTLEHLKLIADSEADSDYQEIGRVLRYLTRLTRLDLGKSMFNAAGVNSLCCSPGLDRLCELHLDATFLREAKFEHLSSLTKLSAADAGVDNEVLLHLSATTSLRELCLAENVDIDAQGIRHLSNLRALTRLDVSACGLDADAIGAIAGIRSLAELQMQRSGHNGDALAPLSQLTRLHMLDVSGTRAGPSGALHIGKCTRLRSLNISHNRIGDAGVANLVTLRGLEDLNLCCNGISANGASHLPQAFTCLTCLNICFNDLGVAGALFMAQLTQLRELHIILCELDRGDVQHLSTLQQLTKCDFLQLMS